MKHNIYKLLICTILLSVISACDFLEERPTTSLYNTSAYASEAGLEAGIIGCYASMQGGAGWQGEFMEFLQFASGLVSWGKSRSAENWLQTLTLSMFPSNSVNEKYYSFFYTSIYNCNKLIENLPDSPVEDSFKNEIEAEARLIRAINYFALVRLYGDVPLITRTAKNIYETSSPRVSYMKIYEQILEDLTYAETNMRSPERQKNLTGTTGRPHKWAATSFKVAVYAQIACLIENKEYQFFDYKAKPERKPDFSFIATKDGKPLATAEDAWELCLSAAEAVKNSNAYSLAYSYADLFRWTDPADYQLNERIFVLQSTDNGAQGVYTAVRTLPDFPQGTVQTVTNSNTGRIRPGRFVLHKWASVHGGELGEGRSDGYTVYERCPDPRYDLSYYHTSYKTLEGDNVYLYPSDKKKITNENGKEEEKTFVLQGPEPYFKKYLNPRYNLSCSYADFYLMRYAEVLLYAAEAAASLNQTSKAYEFMEEIHARARRSIEGGSAYPKMADWGNLTTKEELVSAIMWERVFELHGEGHEFFDTHRRGAKFMSEWLTKPLNAYLKEPEQKSAISKLFNNHYLPENVQELRKSILLAFPEVEFRNNSEIGADEQNDFYFDYLPETFTAAE